jgi:hypothetical protein
MAWSGYNNNFKRKTADFSRASKQDKVVEFPPYGIFIVTAATPIANQNYRWKYEIKPAILDQTTGAGTAGPPPRPGRNTPYVIDTAPTTGWEAYSISEMSNNIWGTGVTRKYAYGVVETDFSNTNLLPVQIPIGTAVFAVAAKMDEGKGYFIIINTQAITGSC